MQTNGRGCGSKRFVCCFLFATGSVGLAIIRIAAYLEFLFDRFEDSWVLTRTKGQLHEGTAGRREAMIGIVGDVMLGHSISPLGIDGATRKWALPSDHVWGNLKEVLHANDLNIFNLEMALTESTVKDPEKGYNFRSSPADAVPMLVSGNFHVAILANNHVRDFGHIGLLDTIAALRKANISYVGAGENITEASQPLLFTVHDITVGVIAVLDNSVTLVLRAMKVFPATEVHSGVFAVENQCIVDLTSSCGREFRSKLGRAVSIANRTADIVLFFLHYSGAPKSIGKDCLGFHMPSMYRKFAHEVLDSYGVDVFIGTHPHHFQAFESYKGKPIIASPGQFVDDFQAFEVCPLRNELGYMFRLKISCSLKGQGACSVPMVEMLPITVNHTKYRVEHSKDALLAESMRRLRRASMSTGVNTLVQHPQKLLYHSDGPSAAIRILPLGDSITQSCCCRDGSSRCCDVHNDTLTPIIGTCCRKSYRKALFDLLSKKGVFTSFTFVGSVHELYSCGDKSGQYGMPSGSDYSASHSSFWGSTSSQIWSLARKDLSHLEPDIVLLMAGTNDVIHQPLHGGTGAAHMMAVLNKTRNIITAASSIGAMVLVAEVPPCEKRPYVDGVIMCKFPEQITVFNNELEAVVRQIGRNSEGLEPVRYISMKEFSPKHHTYDGLHPNHEGEVFIAKQFYSVLTQLSYLEAHNLGLSNYSFPGDPYKGFDSKMAQDCADHFTKGKWVRKTIRTSNESTIGSLDNYKNCFSYSGTHVCDEVHWCEDSGVPTSCHFPLRHFTSNSIKMLLQKKWIAFIGDSTLRLIWSSIVHSLLGYLDDTQPRHGFEFDEHSKNIDHCREGQCHRVVEVSTHDLLITYDMTKDLTDLTKRFGTFVADWKNHATLKEPDIVVINSGAWDVYFTPEKTKLPWSWYHEKVWDFARQMSTNYVGPVVWVSNTYHKGNFSLWDGKPPVTNDMGKWVTKSHHAQRDISKVFGHVTVDRSCLFQPLPLGYSLANANFNPFHLPGVITDESANILLSSIAAGFMYSNA